MARCVWLNGLDLDSTVVRSVRRILFDSNKIHFTPGSAALDILHKFIDNYINKKKHRHISVPMLDMKEFRGKLVISLD